MDPVTGAALISGGSSLLGGAMGGKQANKAAQQAGRGIAYDPTNPILKGLQTQQAGALSQLFNGSNPFSGLGSGLQRQATDAASAFLRQMSPENRTAELSNPYAQMGFTNPGQDVISAAQPGFQQNLRAANANLGAAAPNRFSSAFAREGIDLNSKALNDFNLFQAQALQQGQGLQLQQQQANQNFLLGARGLHQQGQNDFMQGLMGLLGAGNQEQSNIYGLLQSALGWSQPSDLNVVMGANSIRGLPGQPAARNPLARFGR